MEEKTKKKLLVFIFMILFLPMVQQNLKIIKSGPLYGRYSHAPDVQFSFEHWFDDTYQKGKSQFYNDFLGFRPDLLRLNNQLDFSLFDKIHGKWALLGQENCLYQYHYIDEYYGVDFIGDSLILQKSLKLKAIQDTLEHLGKTMVLVYAPSKADFFPEDFPKDHMNLPEKKTNFNAFLHTGDSLGIKQLDLNSWFISLKKTSKELLFSKQGIHYTIYGSILAADSLVNYLEQRRNIKMVHPGWTTATHTKIARDPDDDIAREQNLIFRISDETFCYPDLQYPDSDTLKKPKAIFVGDSFGLNLVKEGLIQNIFADWEYWYYFNRVYKINYTDEDHPFSGMDNYDWKSALNNTDCIVLIYTTYTLSQIGHGFIEQVYDYYYPKK